MQFLQHRCFNYTLSSSSPQLFYTKRSSYENMPTISNTVFTSNKARYADDRSCITVVRRWTGRTGRGPSWRTSPWWTCPAGTPCDPRPTSPRCGAASRCSPGEGYTVWQNWKTCALFVDIVNHGFNGTSPILCTIKVYIFQSLSAHTDRQLRLNCAKCTQIKLCCFAFC